MSASRFQQCVRPELQALKPYAVADARGMVKLDAMENPYTWPAELRQAWLDSVATVGVNRYPDPQSLALKARLRELEHLPDSLGLLLGNGSDEIIQLVSSLLAKPGATVLSVEPAFVVYKTAASLSGLRFVSVPLLRDNDFALDRQAMLAAIEQHQPSLLYLAYPNNPTGNLFDPEVVRELIEAAPGLVVIDEAYQPFAEHSLIALAQEYEQVLVMRTLSKLGLAGLRLGYAVAQPVWIEALDAIRMPYNINVLTQHCAEFALQHSQVFNQQAAEIRQNREHLADSLRQLGLKVFPSSANFLLFQTAAGQADRIFDRLKQQRVLVKNVHGASAQTSDCLRVSVGTAAECEAFVRALKQAL